MNRSHRSLALSFALFGLLACNASTDDDGELSESVADLTDGASAATDGDSFPDDDSDVGDDPEVEPAEAPSLATAPKPKALEVAFNDPEKKGDRSLEKGLEELISLASPGSSIHIALYGFTRSSPAKALIKAHKERNVDVQLVLDGSNEGNNAVKLLRAALPAGAITLCHHGKGSCIGTVINHNKFVLFSALNDGSKDVVWQSSQNLTGHQLRVHNNSVIVRDDAKLYSGYRSYWHDLSEHKENANYYTVVDGKDAKAYFFPRKSGDTVLSILDNVRCHKDKSTIRIAMGFFLNSRVSVANKLVALKRAGCSVEVLLNPDAKHTGKEVVSTLRNANVRVRTFHDAGNAVGIHSKYLLIDSDYDGGGTERRQLIFTGSHNYTGGALRANDETLLRVDDDAAFAAFEADYAKIRAHTD